MKKLKQTTNILYLVALAFIIKAFMDQEMIMILVALLLIAIAYTRSMLLKKVEEYDDEEYSGEDSIKRYLKKDLPRFCEMLYIYEQGNCEILYEENDGILLYDHTLDQYMASATNVAGAKDILVKIPQDYTTFVVFDSIFQTLEEKEFKYQNKESYYNCIRTSKELYELPPHDCTFAYLSEKDIDVVKTHYRVKELCDDKYIGECIQRGMLGVYVHNELAGFMGMHDNGSLGLLEIFPKFQQQGLATILEMKYINDLLEKGYSDYIFSQIMIDNEVSMKLQEKLGFTKADIASTWYFN